MSTVLATTFGHGRAVRRRAVFAIVLCLAGVLSLGSFAAQAYADSGESAAQLTTGYAALQTQAVKKYDLWVAGKRVTSKNAKNVLGDKTVSYNAKTNTLTLKNATLTKAVEKKITVGSEGSKRAYKFYGGIFQDPDSSKTLKIKLVGTNKVAMPSKKTHVYNYGIYASGEIILYGSGSLKVTAGKSLCYSSAIAANVLTLKGSVKVSAIAKKAVGTKAQRAKQNIAESKLFGSCGLIVWNKLVIKDKAQLTALGANGAISKDEKPKISFGSGYTPQVKAGTSSSKIKVNKKKPATSVYTKYKYLKITKAKAASASSYKPAKMAITSIAGVSGGVETSWKTLSKKCTGYEYQISEAKTFPAACTWTFKTSNVKVNSSTVSSLADGLRYYVRIRGFNKVGSKTYYGAWSAVKSTVAGVAAG